MQAALTCLCAALTEASKCVGRSQPKAGLLSSSRGCFRVLWARQPFVVRQPDVVAWIGDIILVLADVVLGGGMVMVFLTRNRLQSRKDGEALWYPAGDQRRCMFAED